MSRLARWVPWIGLAVAAQRGVAQHPAVTEQVSGTRMLLQAVDAVDPSTAWTSGSGGTVLRTVDGGTTWQARPVPGASRLQFRGLFAASRDEAWIMSAGNGPDSRIYHTADGGATWQQQFVSTDSAAFFDCIKFFDRRHGVAFSDASHGRTNILRTDDGGAHWALLPASDVPAPLEGEGAFASSNGCIAMLDKSHALIGASEPGARVFASGDAGRHWSLLAASTPLVHATDAGFTGLSFRDRRHGMAVAATINSAMAHDTSPNAVAVTSDGGATWVVRARPAPPGALSGVAEVPRVDGRTAVIASYGGLFVTRDDGATWDAATTYGYWAVAATGRRAWAVGPGGRITRLDF